MGPSHDNVLYEKCSRHFCSRQKCSEQCTRRKLLPNCRMRAFDFWWLQKDMKHHLKRRFQTMQVTLDQVDQILYVWIDLSSATSAICTFVIETPFDQKFISLSRPDKYMHCTCTFIIIFNSDNFYLKTTSKRYSGQHVQCKSIMES